jgi:hypothetical protein
MTPAARPTLPLITTILVCLAPFAAMAQQQPRGDGGVDPAALGNDPVDIAMDKGLQWLARIQQPDGSFSKITGVNGLALMAFLGAGHVPGEGKYHAVVERGIRYIVNQQSPEGYLGDQSGRMYGHGMATLLLGEVVGMTYDPQQAVKVALPKAVQVILNAQAIPKAPQHQGGWRYMPNSRDSDLSVAGWQMIALRAAKDAGIRVPKESIDAAIAYVKRCAHPNGGFGYTGPGQSPSTTAVGMVSLQMAGEYDAPEVWKAADVFLRNPWGGNVWFYYTVYYGTFAMYTCGGKYWQIWQDMLKRALIPLQREDGSWPRGGGTEGGAGGEVYCTSMALLALSIQYHYLPAYQK